MTKIENDKIVVSPFEYAIRSVAEPETLDKYRAETTEEKAERIRKDFKSFVNRIKFKRP